MNRAAGLIAVLLAVVATVWWLTRDGQPAGESPPEAGTAPLAPPPQVGPPLPNRSILEVVSRPARAAEPAQATLRGRVLDSLGEPLAGCAVRFERSDANDAGASAPTGSDGRFALSPEPGADGWVAVEHRDFPTQVAVAGITVRAHEDRDLGDIVLASRPGLVVIVRGRAGQPLPGARVSATPALRDVSLPSRAQLLGARAATSDGHGRAVLYGLAPGPYALRVEADEHASVEQPHLHQAELTRAPEVQVTLEPGSTISGRVIPPDGGELGRTVVQAEPLGAGVTLSTLALPSGEFRLAGATVGRYRLSAESTRYVGSEVEVATPTERAIALPLRLGEILSGTVRARATGAAIADVLFEAEPEDGWPLQRAGESVRPQARADANGTFRIVGLPAGRFTLRASSESFVPVRIGPLTIPSPPLDVRLDAGLTVSGRIELQGHPPAEATISVVDRQADGSAFVQWKLQLVGSTAKVATSDGLGCFTLRGVEPGRHRLQVDVPGCPPQLSTVLEGSEGATLDLGCLTVIPGAVISGSAAPRATVCLDRLGSPGLTRNVIADDHGQFVFRGLAAGEYELFYHFPERAKPAATPAQRQATKVAVTLAAGGAAEVQLPRN